MTMLSTARLLLHPGRRPHDGAPPKRRPLAPVCLFGKCDAVETERVYRREMAKERQRFVDRYELVEERTPSMERPEERNPLTEVVGEENRVEAMTGVDGASREERTPTMDGGVVRAGRVTKVRQPKLTDLWTKAKIRSHVTTSDVSKRTTPAKKASHS